MALSGVWQDWKGHDKQGVIRDALLERDALDAPHTGRDCLICRSVFNALQPRIGERPIVFRFKRDGVWYDHVQSECERRLGNLTRDIHGYMTGRDRDGEPTIAPVIAAEPEPEPEPIQAGHDLTPDERTLIRRLRELRVFAADRDIDHISYRPIQDGRRMLRAGIPVDGILSACTLHWDAADRRQAGVRDWSPERDFPGGRSAYLDALVDAGILIYLYGPAGMGKSFWAKDLARRRFGGEYGFSPMTEGASVGWLLGRVDLQGFKPTRLLDIWQNGGVYLFDEADAADANMMLVMNGPLADDEGRLDNPIDGEIYYRDPAKTCLIFAGNTDGTGADSSYNARNPFDFSTLDRVRMGRVFVGYDEDVEMQVFMAA